MKSLLCQHFSLSFSPLPCLLVTYRLWLSEHMSNFSRAGNVQWENVECHQETVNPFMYEVVVDCKQYEQYM